MADDNSTNNTEVFVYTERAVIPDDVVRVRVHPSVTVIPERAFDYRKKLEEVELCEGLLEIHNRAFMHCTLTRIKIPSTVTRIFWGFFQCRQLEEVELCEGVSNIDVRAFSETKIKRIKIPSTVKLISFYAFANCILLDDVELCDGLQDIYCNAFNGCTSLKHIVIPTTVTTKIRNGAFSNCNFLRDIAIPLNANIGVGNLTFGGCKDLYKLFDSEVQIINALKHRFDNLPIHKMIYYQSYNNMTVEQLNDATNMRRGQRRSLRSKLDPTGSQQDCLGMTPLHIMACSTVQNIGLYKVLVEKYPENLITKDRWGALPLLYAVWEDAPDEIIQFLIESYQSLYPDHEFNWTNMMKTLSVASAQEGCIQNLLDIQEEFYPEQSIDWDQVFKGLAEPTSWHTRYTNVALARHATSTFKFLVKYSISPWLNSVGLKQWRDDIITDIENIPDCYSVEDTTHDRNLYHVKRTQPLAIIKQKLSCYRDEYLKLKEATTMIELTLWKNKIYEAAQCKGRCKKKPKNELTAKDQCRISCGADIVIEHVLPYLLISVPANVSSIEIESEDDGSDIE